MMSERNTIPRHSGENWNPEQSLNWTPAYAGVTFCFVVIARFIRAIHPSRLAARAPQDEGDVRIFLDYRNKPGNDSQGVVAR